MALLKWFLLVSATIACHVDIAAAAVTITDEPYTASIAENAAVGDTVETVKATTGVTGEMIVYSLESQEPDTDLKIFAINGDTGVITVGDTTHLDYETDAEYTLTVKAAEKGTTTVSATTIVTVTVTDVNESPTFVESTYEACVNKDSPAGTSVVQVTATDEDGDTLKYAITAGDPGSLFEVSDGGIIKVADGKTVGDTPTSYSLTLTATDDDGESGTTTVSVTVQDACPTQKPTIAPPGYLSTTTMAQDNSATTAVIPFHALLASAVILVCQFSMKL